MADKTWGGRFDAKTDSLVETFTSSIDVDRRLYAYDIQGSMAHARMLAKCGIISDAEAGDIIQGLGQIKEEIERGDFTYSDSLEDIHTHIEKRLTQIKGAVALKLHTARSRNDQVALDVRLYLRHETAETIRRIDALRNVLVDLAEKHIDLTLPGYTHLQRAQPVLLAHHLLAYYEMFTRDAGRFADCGRRINVLPLGAGAIAGTPHPIDRHYTAGLLDFPAVTANSMDTVADRDFLIEFCSAASICMVHLSRFSEELILWSSSEFRFIDMPDAFATGSSMMPQKKNPDVPELVRGKTGRVFGHLMAMLTLMKSLPMTYNRDMQEDKPALFDTVDTLQACLDIYARMLPAIKFNGDIMAEAAGTGYLNATDLADYLATHGMPFRDAHACAGKIVAYAIKDGREIHELKIDEIRAFSDLIQPDVFEFLKTDQVVQRRMTFGGTSPVRVAEAIDRARRQLEGHKKKGGE